MDATIGTALVFDALFISGGVGKTGLTVTVDVYNHANTKIVTDGAATAIGGGLYTYTLAAGSNTGAGNYRAVFKTADVTVVQQHIAAVWIVGRSWVQNMDAAISTRATQTSVDTVASYIDTEVAAIKAKTDNLPASPANEATVAAVKSKTDNLPSDPADASDIAALINAIPNAVWSATTRTLTSAGATAADTATAVWAALTSALTTAGSIGKLLTDNVDAKISSRATPADVTGGGGGDMTQIESDVAAIKAKTDMLPSIRE